MPTTIESQAIAALKTALDGVTSLTTKYLDRRKPIPAAALPAGNLVVLGSRSEDFIGHGVDAYRLDVVVALYDQAESGETATALLSTLRGDTRAKILADHTLGGLVVNVEETETDIDVADLPGAPEAGGSALAFSVLYWTRPGDPYTAGP